MSAPDLIVRINLGLLALMLPLCYWIIWHKPKDEDAKDEDDE